MALQCLTGALKDNTEAVNKMREQQERTDKLLSNLAEEFRKSREEQTRISKTCLAETRTVSEQIEELNIQRTVNPLLNSTLIDTNQSNSSENSNPINISIEKLNRALESSNGKMYIKRKFTLNNKSNLDVWLDQMNSELSKYELTEYINNPEKFKDDVTEKTIKMNNKIRSIILSHDDINNYKKLLNIKDPHEILKKIREIRRIETNTTDITVRQKLYKIKKSNKEKVSEEEIKAAFYNAVCDSSQELRSTYLIKSQTRSQMTKQDMINCLLQVEAQRQSTSTEIRANQAQSYQSDQNRST